MKSRRPERGGKTACTQGVAVEMKRQNKFKSYSRLLCLATVWLWDRKEDAKMTRTASLPEGQGQGVYQGQAGLQEKGRTERKQSRECAAGLHAICSLVCGAGCVAPS